MATTSTLQLKQKTVEGLTEYYKSLQNLMHISRGELRSRLEEIDREYQRENDMTKEAQQAKAANRNGDPSKYRNMTVPVVAPQVETAVVYQTSVFLTREPLFGVVAVPEFMDAALQLETVITENSIHGGWAREFIMFFRDGCKYNLAPIEVTWEEEVTVAIVTDLTKSTKQGIGKEVIWAGNKISRLCPYNTFWDTRVAPTEVYKKGDFAGYTFSASRIALKTYISKLPDANKLISNIRPAFESGNSSVTGRQDQGSMSYYEPTINQEVSVEALKGDTNWLRWAGLSAGKDSKINYKDAYDVTVVYCRLLPSDFDLRIPSNNTPQIFKLIFINHEHLIYVEHLTNAHNYLPILIAQPNEDGLRYQTKSLADNAIPFQQLTTSYMTSIIQSRRRAVADRVLYDPSKIAAKDINSPNPAAKIPVRPAAFGQNLAEAVYAFPYREDQAANSMQQISALLGLANTLNGQNQASQGQFVRGNKTLHEFESVMQNASGRDQLTSILLEHQVFVPLKHMLKTNILQYQGGTSLVNRDKNKLVEIDPIMLRKAVMDFKVSDGLTPNSKLINSETLAVAFQTLGSSPQLAAGYNIAPLFSYLMKTQGADLRAFEKSPEQIAYEQALQTWQFTAQLALEKGLEPNTALPPQPKPADFGYNPNTTDPANRVKGA